MSPRKFILFCALGAVLCLIGLVGMARAAEPIPYGSHPAADQYDPYHGIKNKDGVLCCSGDDCKRALAEELFDILPQGGYRIRSSNEIVGEGQVANSPDGNWHICRRADVNKTVRCLMIPNGGV